MKKQTVLCFLVVSIIVVVSILISNNLGLYKYLSENLVKQFSEQKKNNQSSINSSAGNLIQDHHNQHYQQYDVYESQTVNASYFSEYDVYDDDLMEEEDDDLKSSEQHQHQYDASFYSSGSDDSSNKNLTATTVAIEEQQTYQNDENNNNNQFIQQQPINVIQKNGILWHKNMTSTKDFNRIFANPGFSNSRSSSGGGGGGGDGSSNAAGDQSLPMIEQGKYDYLERLYLDVILARNIFIYLGGFITFVGTLLNLICIIIFFKSKLFRNSTFPYYVYLIAIVDTLNLFIRYIVPQGAERIFKNVLRKKVGSANFTSLVNYDDFTSQIITENHCNIFVYLYNSLTLISVWLMVAISFERWLATKFKFQTKLMLKLRAALILTLIIVAVLLFNIFDLSPGFYTPQWFANITLLCERDDTTTMEDNSTDVYKQLGPIKFDTNIYSFIKIIVQTVVPFLAVFLFNTLIIYNYKRIKLTALGNGHRNKSNSCASVMSGGSAFSHLVGNIGGGLGSCAGSIKHRCSLSNQPPTLNQNASNSFRCSRKRRHKFNDNGGGSGSNCLTVEMNNGSRRHSSIKPALSPSSNNIIFSSNSSRSPSPMTPTSLVAALNLAANRPETSAAAAAAAAAGKSSSSNLGCLVAPQTITTAATTPTGEMVPISGSGSSVCFASSTDDRSNSNSRCSPNKNYNHNNSSNMNYLNVNGGLSSSYLMPPTPLSAYQQQRLEQINSNISSNNNNNNNNNNSVGNSSVNLSVVTITGTSNATTTTMLNNHQQQQQVGSTCACGSGRPSRDGLAGLKLRNNSFSNIIRKVSSKYSATASGGGGGNGMAGGGRLSNAADIGSGTNLTVATANTGISTSRVSFKRRASKIRLNRETDIMLIILSFSILLSQLPCTIAWHLIYYNHILINISGVFTKARTPIILYVIRLLEMVYFSLNFIFYITLSPSLRKELKESLTWKKFLKNPIISFLTDNNKLLNRLLRSRNINGAAVNGTAGDTSAKLNNNNRVVCSSNRSSARFATNNKQAAEDYCSKDDCILRNDLKHYHHQSSTNGNGDRKQSIKHNGLQLKFINNNNSSSSSRPATSFSISSAGCGGGGGGGMLANLRECASANALPITTINNNGGGNSSPSPNRTNMMIAVDPSSDYSGQFYKVPSISIGSSSAICNSNNNNRMLPSPMLMINNDLSGLSINLNQDEIVAATTPQQQQQNKRSNSSSPFEYHYFFEKLRSISPMGRLVQQPATEKAAAAAAGEEILDDVMNLDEEVVVEVTNNKKRNKKVNKLKRVMNLLGSGRGKQQQKEPKTKAIKNDEKNGKDKNTTATKNANIQIVIDNMFDNEEEEVQMDIEDDLIVDTSELAMMPPESVLEMKNSTNLNVINNQNSKNSLKIYNNPLANGGGAKNSSSSPSFLSSLDQTHQANVKAAIATAPTPSLSSIASSLSSSSSSSSASTKSNPVQQNADEETEKEMRKQQPQIDLPNKFYI